MFEQGANVLGGVFRFASGGGDIGKFNGISRGEKLGKGGAFGATDAGVVGDGGEEFLRGLPGGAQTVGAFEVTTNDMGEAVEETFNLTLFEKALFEESREVETGAFFGRKGAFVTDSADVFDAGANQGAATDAEERKEDPPTDRAPSRCDPFGLQVGFGFARGGR